jgi:hypothetical protein
MVERASVETILNASLEFESTLNMHSCSEEITSVVPNNIRLSMRRVTEQCRQGRASAKTVVLPDVIYELFKLIFSIIIW